MAYLNYRGHTIVSSAVYDGLSGKWKSAASASSVKNGTASRQLHFVRNSPELFARFEDAENAGMEAAKNWVDLAARGGPFPLAAVPKQNALFRKLFL
jgi:hypothetical protein